MYDCRENEHQELFQPDVDLKKVLPIHIPSPIGQLGYYVYVRVPSDVAGMFADVKVKLDVGGLREDHLTIEPNGDCPVSPSKADGLAWVRVCKAMVSRGDGTLEFLDLPPDVKNGDLLLCTWPRFVESGMADEWIQAQSDPAWAASGVPLGGIGSGRVDICRDGRFRNFSMNNNQDAPVEDPNGLPDAFLAVSMSGQIIDIATRPIVSGHDACGSLQFDPRFPCAMLAAKDVFPQVDANITLFGPLTPHNIERSALPGFVIKWRIENRGERDEKVRCHFGWPNMVGIGGGVATVESGIGYGDGYYRHWDDPTGRRESRVELADMVGVRYSGTPASEHLASDGVHIIGVSAHGCKADARCGAGIGEVIADVMVPAGGSAEVTMALAVAMPNWIDSLEENRGHLWQTSFGSAEEIIVELIKHAGEIESDSGALSAHLDDGTLPAWLRRRLSNCNYPLVTNSVLYGDGRFSINEGPTEMAGCYGTIDQRLAAHPSTQIFFPELNKTELGLFADIQGKNGGICHDLGGGHLERTAGEMTWPDLTCSFVIQTARHAWTTGDKALGDAMWPKAKAALIRHSKWADDGGGVAQVGEGLGTSYDGYHYTGTTGYMATLWIAALDVAEKWANERGETDILVDIVRWRDAAVKKLDHDLWNGNHYIAYGNGNGVRRDTCHAGQLAGQAFTKLLCGRNVLPMDRMSKCIDSIMTLNGSEKFRIPPDEASSDGEAATSFGWLPYLEGFMLSAVASTGDARVWPLWERMMAAVDRDGESPCDTRLMYRPTSGEPSWGWCYMTAPASWLVYDAILDFTFTAADGTLRLGTDVPGRYPIVHPLFWGTADVSKDGISLEIKRVFIPEKVSVSRLAVPERGNGVVINGKSVEATGCEGDYRLYDLPSEFVLTEGAKLTWKTS